MPGCLLHGKTDLVTGGAQGTGHAICGRFAADGTCVGVLDMQEDRAEQAAHSLRDRGAQAPAYAGDVALHTTFEHAVQDLERRHGHVDILVNNAIRACYGTIESTLPETLVRMTSPGFHSVVWGTQSAAAAMSRSGGGCILNNASAASFLASSDNCPITSESLLVEVGSTHALL